MAEPIRFHLDPLCPWCWQTSRWVRRLAELSVVEPTWGVFSLELNNFTHPIDEFDPDRARAIMALRTFVAVRERDGSDAAGRFYAALGVRYFDHEQDVTEPDTIEGALTDAGLDAGRLREALADPSTWDALVKEHQALVADTRSFGVPTIRLDGGTGPAIFGPVISNPPASDDEAVELWRCVSWLTRYENFSELKRDRTIDPNLNQFRTRKARME